MPTLFVCVHPLTREWLPISAVADLALRADREDCSPREDGDEDPSSLLAEDGSLLSWPEEETVLQIEAADDGDGETIGILVFENIIVLLWGFEK